MRKPGLATVVRTPSAAASALKAPLAWAGAELSTWLGAYCLMASKYSCIAALAARNHGNTPCTPSMPSNSGCSDSSAANVVDPARYVGRYPCREHEVATRRTEFVSDA